MPGVPGNISPPGLSATNVLDLTGRLPALISLSDQQIIMVESIQGLFLHHGQSLADPSTAAAYRTTLEAVRLLLEGAFATGELSAGQYATLASLMDAADEVPDIL